MKDISTIEQLLVYEGKKANKKDIVFVSEEVFQKDKFFKKLGLTEEDRQENEAYLKNIEKYPHALVLVSLMDRGVKAEHVGVLPILIKKEIGSMRFEDIYNKLTKKHCDNIVVKKLHHRYGSKQAQYLRNAIERIHENFNSNISNLWNNKPSSSRVVAELLQFDGCGIKIATMITNLLHRHFNVEFSDYTGIDVSPDLQVIKVLKRTGLLPLNLSGDLTKQLAIYKAKEINPDYPGIIDLVCWDIGRKYCSEQKEKSKCEECPLGKLCIKQF